MIKRDTYLKALQEWREKQVIKVVTGVRRCGKSTLFQQYISYLLSVGVKQEKSSTSTWRILLMKPSSTISSYITTLKAGCLTAASLTFSWTKLSSVRVLKKQ